MHVYLQKVKTLLTSWFLHPEDLVEKPYEAFRVLMIVAMLSVIALVLFGFTVFHLFFSQQIVIALMDVVSVVVLVTLVYKIHQNKKVGWEAHLASVAILIFLPMFAYFNQNQELGIVWVFFAPFVFVALVGWRNAFIYLIVFYVVILSLAFNGIGQWDDGTWSQLSFVRLSIGLLLGSALAILMDVANRSMNHQVKVQRAKELVYSEELRRLSTTDSLTNVYNRHYLNEVFADKLEALQESDLYLTFFILDIDHFKFYNDQFGHVQGDTVLQQVAKTVRDYVKRKEDLVFRLGGEEFGGLLVTDNPTETSQWVAKIKNEVEALQMLHADNAAHKVITISIGIYSAKVKQLNTLTCLYRRADQALYEAKNQGRNQAVIIDPSETLEDCV